MVFPRAEKSIGLSTRKEQRIDGLKKVIAIEKHDTTEVNVETTGNSGAKINIIDLHHENGYA